MLSEVRLHQSRLGCEGGVAQVQKGTQYMAARLCVHSQAHTRALGKTREECICASPQIDVYTWALQQWIHA